MIISYKWLAEYLPEPLSLNDLNNILTSIGLEVEQTEPVEKVKGSLEGLVIGEVLSCEKHPNADKLSVTTVNIGANMILPIVCGAPNVAAGQKVIIAPVGTKIHPLKGDSFEIKKAKIRGEVSEGMICAQDEIGLGEDHNGIMVLPADAKTGTLAREFFQLPEADTAIHIGLTPNRSDAMSHIGVAKDVCAYLSHHHHKNAMVKKPVLTAPATGKTSEIAVEIKNVDACSRYCGLTLKNVHVKESPEWLKERLQTIGLRSINNIVDITNFVLHEYGQPLHAFDADKIEGKKVIVQLATVDSKFKTLDEKEIALTANDLMICDTHKPMCLAGIYGGANSGVTEKTTSIFLESAYFNPSFIRKSSLHHGLRTDAAQHFEKGVDINNLLPALIRAAQLMTEYANAEITSDIIDIYPAPFQPRTVKTSYSYIKKLSGKAYSNEAVKTILTSLGFELTENNDALNITVPSNKTDVTEPADIVEEIVRIDGLDNIVIPEKLNIALLPSRENDRKLKEKCAEMLCGEGLQEIVTNSVTNEKYYPEAEHLVKMINSLSSELNVMRPSMLESGLEVILYNSNRKNSNLAFFEFGKIYKQQERYTEEEQLALWFTGDAVSASWNQKQKSFDLFYVKGILQNLFSRNGITKLASGYENETVRWKYKNQLLAQLQPVAEKKLKEFDIKQPVYFAFVNWEVFVKAAMSTKIRYAEVPKFPSVQRDLALVLDKTVSYEDVQKTTEQLNIQSLQDYKLFDVFENEKLGLNKKSYALSYTFQLADRTLTDVEIEHHIQQLVTAYETKLQATIRK